MIEELWKDVVGYEGLYMISNIGRVRSVERYVSHKKYKSGKKLIKGRILKQLDNGHGYIYTQMSDYNKCKCKCYIHRLVAQAFIPNINNKPQVNHLDWNRSNNKLDNLEWCTQEENMKHAHQRKIR